MGGQRMRFQRIAICDDENVSLITMKKYIEKKAAQYQIACDISTFQSAESMMSSARETMYDICFLDIDMPQINGIDLAEQICQKNPQTMIVFVSGKEEYVFQSFRVHPFCFVRKAYFQEDMARVIRDIACLLEQQKNQEQSCVIVDEAGYQHTFWVDSIWYLEAREKYVNIVLGDGEKLLRCSMKSLEKELEVYGLIRCHKSYIVNIKKVHAVKHDHLVLLDKTELPIRRGIAAELKKQLCSALIR